jgi:hypothetical protein
MNDCAIIEQSNIEQRIVQKLKSKSDKELQELHKRIIHAKPLKLLYEADLKIKGFDKKIQQQVLMPLVPNQPQRRFLQLFRTLRATGKPIRIVILKARQWGGTTITDAIMYALTSQQSNVNAMIIADDAKGAGYILEMAKTFHEELVKSHSYLAPEVNRSNRLELAFKDTRSTIFIDSAENKDAGQKYTLQYLHCSEVSKYHHTDDMFKGLLPAVSKAPGSFVVLESTANGVGDYFYRIVKEAEENNERVFGSGLKNEVISNQLSVVSKKTENCSLPTANCSLNTSSYDGEWLLFFVPWMEHEEYSTPFKNETAKQEFVDSLTDQEKLLLTQSYQTIDGMKQVTPEQLNWRRWIMKQEFHGDEDSFHEMYPSTIDEAFLVSGRSRFHAGRVKELCEYAAREEYRQGVLAFPTAREMATMPGLDAQSVLFHPESGGEWKIWEMPDYRCEYVIAIDTAGGEEIEGTSEGKKGDYNVIEVFKRGDVLTQVGEYRSRIDPDLLADEAYMAYLAYNQPIIFLEVNNHGRTTADHLKHRCSVYRREVMDEVTRTITKKLGWFTDKSTKKQMIDTLAEAIRDGWILIRSTVLAGEMRTYVRGSDGSTNAQEGCFDDTVMACALAVQAHMRTHGKGAFKVIQMENKAMGGR